MVVNYRSKKFYNIGPRSEFDGLTELGRKVLPGTKYTRSNARDENKVSNTDIRRSGATSTQVQDRASP